MTGPDRTSQAAGSSRHREHKVQPPRPPNAWILYRSYKFAEIRQSNERHSQAAVSKMISDMWKNETDIVKRHFERMAEDRKAEHQQLYPDYRFAPQKREDKMRAKEDRKQTRLAKRSKTRDATPVNATTSTTAAVPAPLPMPFMHQPFLLPGYQTNMIMPPGYMFPFLPEAHYAPSGPSPPISAAPSPTPYERSESAESLLPSGDLASSSSSPSARPSSSSESQNSLHTVPLPAPFQPSPNPNTTQPLPTPLPQTSAPGLPSTSPQAQPSSESTVIPAANDWNNIHTPLPNPQNSEEVVRLTLPVHQTQNPTELSGTGSVVPSYGPFQGLVSRTDHDGIFSFSSMGSDFLAQPRGQLDVAIGPEAPEVDYRGVPFVDYELMEFERQMTAFTSTPAAADPPIQEDLKSLFRVPQNPEQASTDGRQRQPSTFTEDMMNFLNFDALEDFAEDTPSTISSDPLPTTVAPQLVLQNTEQVTTTPIFVPVTNTSTAPSGTPYVPPAGAIYSSTRRVAATWKLPFTISSSQSEEPTEAWTFPPN